MKCKACDNSMPVSVIPDTEIYEFLCMSCKLKAETHCEIESSTWWEGFWSEKNEVHNDLP